MTGKAGGGGENEESDDNPLISVRKSICALTR